MWQMIPKRFQKLMKEQADLAPIVEAYKEYKEKQAEYRGQSCHVAGGER